jgi:hypothetical protein
LAARSDRFDGAAQRRGRTRPRPHRLAFDRTRGLGKIEPDAARLAADLDDAWEVLGEAVQTVLRAAGIADGYELLKGFTRGKRIDAAFASRVSSRPCRCPPKNAPVSPRCDPPITSGSPQRSPVEE